VPRTLIRHNTHLGTLLDDLRQPGYLLILPRHLHTLINILSNYPHLMALFSTKPYTVAAKRDKLTIGKTGPAERSNI